MDDIKNLSEPANLRFLRRLVTILTAIMILGVLTVISLLVIQLNTFNPKIILPDQIALPKGTVAKAFTFGSNWYAVVTAKDEILIFEQTTGLLKQTVKIK
ncbi:MAG: DUF6476 family protein [Tateyamaria sp.]|nr:DUF6476 family protein [Tateyamaria sp.]MDG1420021.1 DUF6476 family protein [Tateyamaria sp.]MDG1679081.1 DUF6476 family protein [Tateyamaria sp.]MDG2379233.1 DUF6476 family protein [Tateyamaria sp.]